MLSEYVSSVVKSASEVWIEIWLEEFSLVCGELWTLVLVRSAGGNSGSRRTAGGLLRLGLISLIAGVSSCRNHGLSVRLAT